jgi:hypothetical protein
MAGSDRAERAILTIVCLFAIAPMMIVALAKIINLETRSGYQTLLKQLSRRSIPGTSSSLDERHH